MADQWYYTEQRERRGPVSEEQLKQRASSGQLKPTDKVWKKGMANWVPASTIDALAFPQSLEDEPPPVPAEGPPRSSNATVANITRGEPASRLDHEGKGIGCVCCAAREGCWAIRRQADRTHQARQHYTSRRLPSVGQARP